MDKLNNDQINGLLKIIPEKPDLEALGGYTGPGVLASHIASAKLLSHVEIAPYFPLRKVITT